MNKQPKFIKITGLRRENALKYSDMIGGVYPFDGNAYHGFYIPISLNVRPDIMNFYFHYVNADGTKHE